MKARRLIPAILAVFVFIFLYEWVFHGILLKGIYETTPQLWRSQAEMPHFMPFLFGGQLLLSIVLGVIFSKGYENRGVGEGVRFGFLIGLLFAPHSLIWYAIQPLPAILPLYWILGGILKMVLAGILLAAICRPKNG